VSNREALGVLISSLGWLFVFIWFGGLVVHNNPDFAWFGWAGAFWILGWFIRT
jgi:hypothetical protein